MGTEQGWISGQWHLHCLKPYRRSPKTHLLWEGVMLRSVAFSGSLTFLAFTCGLSWSGLQLWKGESGQEMDLAADFAQSVICVMPKHTHTHAQAHPLLIA